MQTKHTASFVMIKNFLPLSFPLLIFDSSCSCQKGSVAVSPMVEITLCGRLPCRPSFFYRDFMTKAMAPSRAYSSKDFRRYAEAPSLIAFSSIPARSCPVMNITGICTPEARSSSRSSNTLMPGSRISTSRHPGLLLKSDWRNSADYANVRTRY